MQVLDAVNDRSAWLERWRACGREPFAHPSYGTMFAGVDGHPIALAIEGEGNVALLPLILRPVPTHVAEADDVVDAISPYGYGGPFLSGPMDIEQVLIDAEDWLAKEGICTAFLRLSLELDLPDRLRTKHTEVAHLSDNIVVNLQRASEELWSNYEHKVRKNVKKALRAGCTVRRDDRLDDVDAFLAVYSATMQRRNAAQRYHFDHSFFATLTRELPGSYSVFWVLDSAGRAVSVELVLESDAYLYSFLGGTLEESFAMSPNDLLKHEVISYGQQTGRRGFVLGGGYQVGDGIYRYKKAFDPQGVRAFRVGKAVASTDIYDLLVANRLRLAEGAPAEGFFPAYRAPITGA